MLQSQHVFTPKKVYKQWIVVFAFCFFLLPKILIIHNPAKLAVVPGIIFYFLTLSINRPPPFSHYSYFS
ncbi:hypothetical protein BX070DRAFT_76075 [Coemansia spiralis]|nr:hypothetical protein BX070DRAFT_76075 [Coemansia spiralis]